MGLFDEAFSRILEDLRVANHPGAQRQLAVAFRAFQEKLRPALFPPQLSKSDAYAKGDRQSRQFMADILPTIRRYIRNFPEGTTFDVLDVGPGTGSGTQLLASLYETKQMGYRLNVSTTDISEHYVNYMLAFCPTVTPGVGNIFSMDSTYDIVIASHVIEHVPEWREFARRLQETARGAVFLCAPYREPFETKSQTHVNIIDDEFLAAIGAEDIHLMESPGWGNFMQPRYQMFIARLPGLARQPQIKDSSISISVE